MIVQFSNSRSVDGKRSIRLRNETFVSKFLRRGVDIVNRGDWLRSLANIKAGNKDTNVYFGRSTTVYDVLFFTHTLCINYVTKTFLLVSSSVRRKQLSCFVLGQETKTFNAYVIKNFDEFHNRSLL